MNTQKAKKKEKFSNIAVQYALGTSTKCWFPHAAKTICADFALEKWQRRQSRTATTLSIVLIAWQMTSSWMM